MLSLDSIVQCSERTRFVEYLCSSFLLVSFVGLREILSALLRSKRRLAIDSLLTREEVRFVEFRSASVHQARSIVLVS